MWVQGAVTVSGFGGTTAQWAHGEGGRELRCSAGAERCVPNRPLGASAVAISLLHSPMAMTMGARRLGASLTARFYSVAAASSSPASAAASGEIGVQDFVKSIKGVEAHADKVAKAIIGVPTLLQTRSSRLKKLGIPCKQRKMILRYTEKYRQGIWTPRMSTKQ